MTERDPISIKPTKQNKTKHLYSYWPRGGGVSGGPERASATTTSLGCLTAKSVSTGSSPREPHLSCLTRFPTLHPSPALPRNVRADTNPCPSLPTVEHLTSACWARARSQAEQDWASSVRSAVRAGNQEASLGLISSWAWRTKSTSATLLSSLPVVSWSVSGGSNMLLALGDRALNALGRADCPPRTNKSGPCLLGL